MLGQGDRDHLQSRSKRDLLGQVVAGRSQVPCQTCQEQERRIPGSRSHPTNQRRSFHRPESLEPQRPRSSRDGRRSNRPQHDEGFQIHGNSLLAVKPQRVLAALSATDIGAETIHNSSTFSASSVGTGSCLAQVLRDVRELHPGPFRSGCLGCWSPPSPVGRQRSGNLSRRPP